MSPSDANAAFPPTAWSRILGAQGRDAQSAQRLRCLEYLAATYWPPVYAFVRRRCRSDDAALDLAQEYFRVFLEKNVLDQLRPEKGRFRTFLLVSVKHFLANQADYRNAARRAPKGRMLSLNMDTDSARAVVASIAAPDEPPETAFMREWARVSVQRAMAQMREACSAHGSLDYVRVLEQHLALANNDQASHEDTARALGWSVEKVKKTLHRARKKFAEALREVLRESVATDDDVEEELAELRRYFD